MNEAAWVWDNREWGGDHGKLASFEGSSHPSALAHCYHLECRLHGPIFHDIGKLGFHVQSPDF